jgi:hypothetical protein
LLLLWFVFELLLSLLPLSLFRTPDGRGAGMKKGPRGPGQRIATFADGLPAPGDAPPKYDHEVAYGNKISHDVPARTLCCAGNLTLRRMDVKRFPDAG